MWQAGFAHAPACTLLCFTVEPRTLKPPIGDNCHSESGRFCFPGWSPVYLSSCRGQAFLLIYGLNDAPLYTSRMWMPRCTMQPEWQTCNPAGPCGWEVQELETEAWESNTLLFSDRILIVAYSNTFLKSVQHSDTRIWELGKSRTLSWHECEVN